MLDINLIRSNPDFVVAALKKREYDVDLTEMLAWDARRKEILLENEAIKAGHIALIGLAKNILECCIRILGFSAPEKM